MDKLRFTPHAVAKMIFLRDIGNTEVSFYAQSDPNDLGKIVDLNMVPQRCNSCYTEFDDNGVADFFDRMVDGNHEIETFARIWCHTHPGTSATPSQRDHQTFKDAFGNNHWAIMFILGTTGEYTCKQRIKCNAVSDRFQLEDIIREIPAIALIPVAGMDIVLEMDLEKAIKAVDWKKAPSEDSKALWKAEYDRNWSSMGYSNGYSGSYSSANFGHYGQSTQGSSYQPSGEKRWVPGAGWRVGQSGHWTKSIVQERIDEQNGITISPDFNTPKDPYYIAPTGTLNKPRQQLTKRERKYVKKHGSLKGFVSPTNTGVKGTSLVKIETQKLAEQSDDGFGWMDEAIAQAKEKEAHKEPTTELNNYTVKLDDMDYIPEKYRGKCIKNVWASGPLEAVNIVHAKIGAPPFRGKLTADGKTIHVPGEGDIEEGDDTELAEDDAAELEHMEFELEQCWKLHDQGKIDLNTMRDMEEEILAAYDKKIDKMYDTKVNEAIAKDRAHEDDGDEDLLLVPEDDEDLATNEGLANFARHDSEFGHGIADSDTHILGFRSDI